MELVKSFYILLGLAECMGLLSIGMTLYWVIEYMSGFMWRSDPTMFFNFHSFFMTIGPIFLFANSFILLRALPSANENKAKWLIFGFQCLIIPLVVLALLPVVEFRKTNHIPEIYSLHAWCGFIVISAFFLQWFLKLINLLSFSFLSKVEAILVDVESSVALFCFILGIWTSVSGLLEIAMVKLKNHYSTITPEGNIINTIGILNILFGAVVVFIIAEYKAPSPSMPEMSG